MIKSLIAVWSSGYRHPRRFSRALAGQPAPWLGLLAQGLRAILNSVLLYVPLALLGRVSSTPSYLTFIPTESYFQFLAWAAPLFLVLQWLCAAAVIYLVLRLFGYVLDFDILLNITGVVALVVGAVLLGWDWLWIILGWHDPVWLGISHLCIDLWGLVLVTAVLKHNQEIPLLPAICAYMAALAASLPLAALIMRAPI